MKRCIGYVNTKSKVSGFVDESTQIPCFLRIQISEAFTLYTAIVNVISIILTLLMLLCNVWLPNLTLTINLKNLLQAGANLFEFFTQNVYTRFFPDSKVSGLYSFFDHFESDSSCSCSVKRQMNRILKHPGIGY